MFGPQTVLTLLDREQIFPHLLDGSFGLLGCHDSRATAAPAALSMPAPINHPKDIGRVAMSIHP
ncbi:hypothetical protein [[Mycobacterium] fortunisiensis]|uniref:hypothetical protein n=1 Tax=[Mycobacterium] fortunisiensis TaxID=2600579 RepID=UPI001C251771|nr:hypothetical protein [[Mycobacterium] fortunisiensis]